MTTTLPRFYRLFQTILASILVLITTSCVFSQFYLQGGSSYWPDFESPSFSQSNFPNRALERSEVDQTTEFWIGGGYKVNEEWSFEAFFSQLPSAQITLEYYMPYPALRPGFRPFNVTYKIETETTVLGVGAAYEFLVNDRVYLIGKAGLTSSTLETKLVDFWQAEYASSGDSIDDDDGIFNFDEFEDYGYVGYDDYYTDEDSSVEMYFAVGARLPIQDTSASVTATYQFLKTPDTEQAGLYLGLRWDL